MKLNRHTKYYSFHSLSARGVYDVCFDLFQFRLADGEVRVTALPFKVGKIHTLLLQPLVGDALEFFNPFSLGDRAAKTRQEVNMVLHPTDQDGRTIEPLGYLS